MIYLMYNKVTGRPVLTRLVLFLALLVQPAWAQSNKISARILFDENVDFTPNVEQPVSATLLSLHAEKSASSQLSPKSRVSIAGSMTVNEYTNYPLDHFVLGLRAAYSKKLGLGFNAPRLRFVAEGELRNFDVDLRDTLVSRIGFGLRKPFSRRFSLTASIRLEKHRVDEGQETPKRLASSVSGNAFDQEFVLAQISTTTRLDQNWSLPIRYSYRDGDLISVSQPNPTILAGSQAANDYSLVRPGSIAYRGNGSAESFTIGLDRSMGQNAVLELSYTHQSGSAGVESKYSRDFLSLEYSYIW